MMHFIAKFVAWEEQSKECHEAHLLKNKGHKTSLIDKETWAEPPRVPQIQGFLEAIAMSLPLWFHWKPVAE